MASGVAVRLHRSHFKVVMTDIAAPLCVRRTVSFSEAVPDGSMTVEDCRAELADSPAGVFAAWSAGNMAVLVDPDMNCLPEIHPAVVVDAVLAKKNLGLTMDAAGLVVALGPGFTAGRDAHVVIETNRGHNLGRLLYQGEAAPNTGVPGVIAGESVRRVLRAPADGMLETDMDIGDTVEAGQMVGMVSGQPMKAEIGGVLRGLIRPGTKVWSGLKAGDVDPRGDRAYCWTVSDKARAIGGAVLEAILAEVNQ